MYVTMRSDGFKDAATLPIDMIYKCSLDNEGVYLTHS